MLAKTALGVARIQGAVVTVIAIEQAPWATRTPDALVRYGAGIAVVAGIGIVLIGAACQGNTGIVRTGIPIAAVFGQGPQTEPS